MKYYQETCEALEFLQWESSLIVSDPVNHLLPCADMVEKWESVYDFYASAMSRRREPLDSGRFHWHFFSLYREEMRMYGSEEDGWLLGYLQDGAFIVSHFAPRSMRSGVRLMTDLGLEDFPAVMGITEDLTDMLSRINGWRVLASGIPVPFRSEVVLKTVFGNSSVSDSMVNSLNERR